MNLEIYPTGEALASAAAFGIQTRLADGLKTRGRASLVGTGGRSPGPTYDLLRKAPIDWARVVVTLCDERCVDRTAPEANARTVDQRLLTGEAAKAHFIPLWPAPPDEALKALAPFDAVMLGMGEDGHVASLIPGADNMAEIMDPQNPAFTAPVQAGIGAPPLPRVTMTLSSLLNSHAIFILIAGDVKRDVITRAAAGEDFPVRALLAQEKVPVRVLWAPSFQG